METKIRLRKSDALQLRALLQARERDHDREELDPLRAEFDRASIVDDADLPPAVVTIGSSVEVLDLETDKRAQYVVVLPAHADIGRGRVSVLAPLGTALIGYEAGDVIEWSMPGGRRRLRIETVGRDTEASRPAETAAA